jgi:LCP family protein required for cell wall assembly
VTEQRTGAPGAAETAEPDDGATGAAGATEAADATETADATGAAAPGGAIPAPPRRRRMRGRRVLLVALGLLLAGTLGAAGFVWAAVEHYTGSVHRIPNVFPSAAPGADQPKAAPGHGTNFLLVGLDSRSDLPTTGRDAKAPQWRPGAQRSDTMMLLHIPANHRNAYVVSLPRDSWVPIPGHGSAKLNAAFSWGGPPLLIDTVQRLTDVHVDHLMVIDWSGFKKLTDSVGGVDVTVEKTIPPRPGERGWTAGRHHMLGEEALAYVRERHGLPGGDLDRTKRQQNFLRSLLHKSLTAGTLSNPLKLRRLLDEVTDVVSVDDRLSNADLRGLVWSMRSVRPGDMVFMNAPVGGFDTIHGQSVVLLDGNDSDLLWEAIRTDTMADYTAHRSVDELTKDVP